MEPMEQPPVNEEARTQQTRTQEPTTEEPRPEEPKVDYNHFHSDVNYSGNYRGGYKKSGYNGGGYNAGYDNGYRKPASGIDWTMLTSLPAIIISFCIGLWPVGVFLILKKLSMGDQPKGNVVTEKTTVRTETRTTTRQSAAETRTAARTKTQTRTAKPQNAKKQTAAKQKKDSHSWLFWVGGAMLLAGIIDLGDTLDMVIWLGSISGYLGDLWTAITLAVAGGSLFGAGVFFRRQEKRFPLYLSAIGEQKAVSFDKLASVMGLSRKKVVRDLSKMVQNGYFAPGAHLDMGLGYFFADSSAAVWEEPVQKEETPTETEEGYSGILRSIRRANDAIADEALSRQIDQIEDITAKIFREVERRPEKKAQIGTFMNYYLPTTQKLLDSYATFESTGVEGDNVAQAKARIETTMERIVHCFAQQLDQLYSSDVMDVESDIRVMESMLNRDESSTEKDFGLKL